MRRRAPLRLTALAALCLGLSACGGGGSTHHHSQTPPARPHTFRPPSVVDVYSSLPLRGPLSGEGAAVKAGIELALAAPGEEGPLEVKYTSLDDADSRGWDQQRTVANAMRVARDPKAVLYVGDLDSAASASSIPVLNLAGIPQISPGSTYIGLTQGLPRVPGATEGRLNEPHIYYPSGLRTFLRVIPADNVQAAAAIEALQRPLGCTRVAIAYDGSSQYGLSLAALLHASAHPYGVDVTSLTKIDPTQTNFHALAEQLRTENANCLVFAGVVSTASIELVKQIHLASPTMRILGTDGVCSARWTNPHLGGVAATDDPFVYCMQPTLPVAEYPGASTFVTLYQELYGRHAEPSPYALFGYEAMALGLDSINQLGSGGANREALRQTLFATTDRVSGLGTYSITATGDTTLRYYGLYRVGAGGDPKFYKVMIPPHVLGP